MVGWSGRKIGFATFLLYSFVVGYGLLVKVTCQQNDKQVSQERRSSKVKETTEPPRRKRKAALIKKSGDRCLMLQLILQTIESPRRKR